MAALAQFGDMLQRATADVLPPGAERKFAAYARRCLAQSIASGFGTEQYDKYVNGRFNVAEEQVKLPGRITYIFHGWTNVIPAALAELRRRVPRGKTGRYQSSFLVIVNRRVVTNYASIPVNSEVIILNAQPYTRKMEVGANGSGEGHFARASYAFDNKFSGAFESEVAFLKVTSGIDARIPYILKGAHAKRANRIKANPNKFQEEIKLGLHHRRQSLGGGQPITYPALILKAL